MSICFRGQLLLAMATAILIGGCEERAVPKAARSAVAPPPPPGSTAGVQSSPAAPAGDSAGTASGLPADLIAKIDKLIQCHKDYIAAAEKVQDPQAAKEQVGAFSELAQRGSDAYEDVMIAQSKLPASQQAAFEAYMNAHVLEINNIRRKHVERLEGLLRQSK